MKHLGSLVNQKLKNMKSPRSASKRLELVSSFQEIAVGQSAETATKFLQDTNWRLEEALQLFFSRSDGGEEEEESSFHRPQVDINPTGWEEEESHCDRYEGEDGVDAPVPMRREALYGDVSSYRFQNVDEEPRNTRIWESNQRSESTSSGFDDNLASIFHEPFALMYRGPFFKAKVDAAFQNRWLLANLQCTEEFSSSLLNRDVWSNDTVAETIKTFFIFWQMYNDTDEGKKVCTYYNLVSLPAILIIDPITGQKMKAWSGMMEAEQLLENLLPFMDVSPKEHIALPRKHPRENVETSMHDISVREDSKERTKQNSSYNKSHTDKNGESSSSSHDCETHTEKDDSSNGKFTYPILAEEPQGNRKRLCRVGIRLPDGRRLQRNFHHSDPVKLLWSFCCTKFEEGETRPFRFTQVIHGNTKNLDYESNLTFGESELSDSMLWLTME